MFILISLLPEQQADEVWETLNRAILYRVLEGARKKKKTVYIVFRGFKG